MKRRDASSLIAAYSLEGKLMKTYPSAKKAAESLHVFFRTIDKAVREGKIIHSRQWKRVDPDDVPLSIPPHQKKTTFYSSTPLAWIDESNIVIKVYPSIKKAALENDVDPHTIRDVLQGKTRFAKGKKYRLLSAQEIKEFGLPKTQEKKRDLRKIVMYSKDGKYLGTYPSVKDVLQEKKGQLTYQGVYLCLKGKRKSSDGYVFLYEGEPFPVPKEKIYQYTKKNVLVGTYLSVKEASVKTHISVSSIHNTLRGAQGSAGGYYWKRK